MNFFSNYTLLTSSSAAIIVAIFLSALPEWRSTTHCYTSIKTLSPSNPYANCFTISSSGTFSRVFTADSTSSLIKNAREGFVIPGLWDGHGHLLEYGELIHSANLFGSNSMNEVLHRLDEHLARNPSLGTRSEWIRGVGWDQAAFGGNMPTAVCQIQSLANRLLVLPELNEYAAEFHSKNPETTLERLNSTPTMVIVVA